MTRVEVSREQGFALEAGNHHLIGRELRAEQLQRHPAPVFVARREDDTHSPLAERLFDAVAADGPHDCDYHRPIVIRFRVLGPVEPAELPGGKPRALFVRLVLEPGRVVPADTLVDALWHEPPASASKVIQVYVSQVRKALGADAIETYAPGYLLRVAPGETDLGRFEQLAEEARGARDAARRAELLREALTLWRGPALAEFADEPFAETAARRLAELRLHALEERLDAELELGEHASVVPDLEELVAEEPLRERPRAQLMLALYRSGRQAEALERYRKGRRLLVEELGIEPGPGLQDLERAILRQDPALAQPGGQARVRGSIVCAVPELAPLVAPLGREVILVRVVSESSALHAETARLEALRREGTRTASFASESPGADLAQLAAEQDADLLLVGAIELDGLLAAAPCDVAFVARPELPFEPSAPVLVPFGGRRDEWAALELAAWLARAHALPLRLLGTEAAEDRRDASRLLASASLALQRFAGTAAEPVLVSPGADGILQETGSLIVASLPEGELGATRTELAERTTVPLLLVHGGLRPSGLAPENTLTRFSWSIRDE
jgi:DNA-binding SARP family transcriptional activator